MSPALNYADVADLYDAYARFDDDIPFFIEECRGVTGPVLELMSGTGRVSLPLAEAGVELTCVDSSAEMLEILERKLAERDLDAAVVLQDVTRLDLPRTFELALLPFHAFAELTSVEEQRAALAAIRRALEPDGRFVCPLHNPPVRLRAVGDGPTVYQVPLAEDGQILVEADLCYDAGTGMVRGTQILRKLDAAGTTVVERSVRICFLLIEAAAFEALVRDAGFDVETVYGDYRRAAFDPSESPYMIWSLRRR